MHSFVEKDCVSVYYDGAFEDLRVWTGQSFLFFIRLIEICQNLCFQLCAYLQTLFLIVT